MSGTDFSLAEYLAQSQRGIMSRVFGPDFLNKQTYFQVADTFTTTYGRKVWHNLNNRTTIWNAIKKVPWGATAGWRVRTDRGSGRSRPITETGALPTVDVSNLVGVSSLPKIIGTTFGVSLKSQFTNTLEGGIGDIFAAELESSTIDHVKEINQELLSGTGYIVSTGAATTFTVPASIAHHFQIGDTVAMYDKSGGAYVDTARAVSNVDTATGIVTVATGTAFADGDVAYIKSRNGMTSIDDIVAYDDMPVGGPALTDNTSSQAASDVYNLTTRTAGTYAAGNVYTNNGVGRPLSLNLLDTAIQNIRENGGEPKLIVMGHDEYMALERLLNAHQRYLGQEEYQVGVGDERTLAGTRTGLILASYMGIPILPEVDSPKSVASTSDTVLNSNVYVLDTDYMEIAVAVPTQYVENRDYFAANALVVRGLFYTLAELRCTNIWANAKITDLNG